MRTCHHCKTKIAPDFFIGRQGQCPSCGADLHCCLNCSFYDASIYNECREIQAERVLEKNRANFCDFFQYKKAISSGGLSTSAKDKLESLFKKYKNSQFSQN